MSQTNESSTPKRSSRNRPNTLGSDPFDLVVPGYSSPPEEPPTSVVRSKADATDPNPLPTPGDQTGTKRHPPERVSNHPVAVTAADQEPASTTSESPPASDRPKKSAGTQAGTSTKRQKITVHMDPAIAERIKNAAYWRADLTVAAIVEEGARRNIEHIEEQNGGPFPQRSAELTGGRPLGS